MCCEKLKKPLYRYFPVTAVFYRIGNFIPYTIKTLRGIALRRSGIYRP